MYTAKMGEGYWLHNGIGVRTDNRAFHELHIGEDFPRHFTVKPFVDHGTVECVY